MRVSGEARHAGDEAAARARAAMRQEVMQLLSRPQKELSPKWFYDARGSALFDEITRLPEYYLTRTERALLEREAAAWLARSRVRTIVELGPGNGEKARILLAALPSDATYVPVDISRTYLDAIASDLQERFPEATILPVEADITSSLALPRDLPAPAVVAFLGSTLGNFDPLSAQRLLRRIAAVMRPDDWLLLGADLKKDAQTLQRAYNDAAGVTAEFNSNILRVLNRELDADFDRDGFEHRAVYDADAGRVEMHLVARRDMIVTIPDAGRVAIAAGESIRTEISTKYDRPGLELLLDAAQLTLEHWFTDDEQRFALLVARRAQ